MDKPPEFIQFEIVPDIVLLESLKNGRFNEFIPKDVKVTDFDKEVLICFTRGCGFSLLSVCRNLVKDGTTGLNSKKPKKDIIRAKLDIESYYFMSSIHTKNDESQSDIDYLERLIFYYYIYLYNSIAKSPKNTYPFRVHRGLGQISRYLSSDPDTVIYLPEFLHTTPSFKIAYSYGIDQRNKKTNTFYMINFYIHPLANYADVSQYLTEFKGEQEVIVSPYNRICFLNNRILVVDDYESIIRNEDIGSDSYYSELLKNDIINGYIIEYNYLILPVDSFFELPKLDELKSDISQLHSRPINEYEKQIVEQVLLEDTFPKSSGFGKSSSSIINSEIRYLRSF
jgi:hypothetical protein